MPALRRTLLLSTLITAVSSSLAASSCNESAPLEFGRTPEGPGAAVRYDLAHTPLPDIPLPIDTATWADPTSRTGLRINASLTAPTEIERDARRRFDELEGWGTFAPITVSFDLSNVGDRARTPVQAAVDIGNVKRRHQGDDYDFENDAIYLIDLETGVPVPLDLGNGNFEYTLKRLDRYWANDTRASERNLLFESRDESSRGSISPLDFTPAHDTDFDGHMDIPNLDEPFACPLADVTTCDNPKSGAYNDPACVQRRRDRDQCIADHLMTFYERETDTLILRPLLPLEEMSKYAVVLTDRLVDANGDPVKSPFSHVFHATQRTTAVRVAEILSDPARSNYYGDIAGTGIHHVAFTWSFTTQPTIDDMKRLRDGLYGEGPFARFAEQFPPEMRVERAIGKVTALDEGAIDTPGWEALPECASQSQNLYVVHVDQIKETLRLAVEQLFGEAGGPDVELLLRGLEHVDTIVIGTFKAPFLLEGGPDNTNPKAAFRLDYLTGDGEVHEDEVQFWLVVPKETAQYQQPFDVNIYGHGYTGNFLELVFYAGNLAQHGLATVGINAMGHQLDFGDFGTEQIAKGLFSGGCVGPLADAILTGRARDLDRDGRPDSGGDFWSSYLFHTRDGVRQSVLDHIQLVRLFRTFGTPEGRMVCQNAETGWDQPASADCDTNGDGTPEVVGDFDGNGVADVGGPDAKYGTWGESLGGILSGIHGAIDAYVTSASPGSGGGGLTDIGVRSFQGGVIEAVLLRLWGPLIVTVPSEEREACDGTLTQSGECTVCAAGEISLRWVMPDTNDTGELEIDCLAPAEIQDTTVLVYNEINGELRCARVEDLRFRVGVPASVGDTVRVSFFTGKDVVKSYETCEPTVPEGTKPQTEILSYGRGRFPESQGNLTDTDTCAAPSCGMFQGIFYGEGLPLTAPAEGYGQIRQTPALRRFIQLAQMALEPGDPISFAPYYAVKPMTDPYGAVIAPHAVLTVNTIGDMNVPLNSGIAFARATGALPFFHPEHATKFPEYADYVTPTALYAALGNKTPNQDLIDNHVIEGVTALARHPAGPTCTHTGNADLDGTYFTTAGEQRQCFPAGCATAEIPCVGNSHCDTDNDKCVPNAPSQARCEEALFDSDDLDEGTALYAEQAAPVPHRLVRYTEHATPATINDVWAPRLRGVPKGEDGGWVPDGRRLTGLLNAYVVPEGTHTFVFGNPCEAWDNGTYLTNLVARFFQTDGTDVHYLSHPKTHLCLAKGDCAYLGATP